MDNLKNLRREKGYTPSQLAAFLKVGASLVVRWEMGETLPTLAQIIKLCRVLGCCPGQLYSQCGSDSSALTLSAPPVSALPLGTLQDKHPFIPVYDGKDVSFSALPANCGQLNIHFGLVLSSDTTDRLCAGDVLYFTIQNYADSDSVVLVSHDGFEHSITAGCTDLRQNILAVCTAFRCSM